MTKHPGRPSDFSKLMNTRDNFLEEVTNYCLLGADDTQLAAFFGISLGQVTGWIEFYPEFRDAVNAGRDYADAIVARAMFKRASGYEYDAQRLIVKDGHAQVLSVTEHVPPDTNAGKYWLNNRTKRWRDKQEHAHTGPNGGALQTELQITFVGAPAQSGDAPMINVTPANDVIEPS